jgi:hypothetical protein
MKKYKIGETFQMDGVDLLVLDYIGENPFVFAYNLIDKAVRFGDNGDYRTSYLKKVCEEWLVTTKFRTVKRKVDLITLNGRKNYGEIEVDVAPLTFDEYRKYHEVIESLDTYKQFWTVTAWDTGSRYCCGFGVTGFITYYHCSERLLLPPTFILDTSPSL